MVHHAAQAQRLAVTAAAAAALLGAGCGGAGRSPAPTDASAAVAKPRPAVIHQDLGVDVRLANCLDWRRGDEAARKGTIEEITGFTGGSVDAKPGSGQSATLSNEQAYALFTGWCANDFASNFKLYKLYTRAAAFTPQQ